MVNITGGLSFLITIEVVVIVVIVIMVLENLAMVATIIVVELISVIKRVQTSTLSLYHSSSNIYFYTLS